MISTIIPCYNSEKTIEKCLKNALNQSISEGFEVIVIDDGSKDNTKEIIQNLAKTDSRIKYTYQENAGPAKARNTGAKQAKGEIIVFLDSDCIPQDGWLKEMIAPFKDQNVVGVQGSYISNQKEISAVLNQLEIEERYELMKKSKQLDWIATYSAAYKKDIFMKEGMFDESFPLASGEDTEFSYKLSEKGYKLVFNDKAVVEHVHPVSFLKYLRVKFFRAYWRILLYRMHPKKMVKDSYTRQEIKAEMLLILSIFFGILSIYLFPSNDFITMLLVGFFGAILGFILLILFNNIKNQLEFALNLSLIPLLIIIIGFIFLNSNYLWARTEGIIAALIIFPLLETWLILKAVNKVQGFFNKILMLLFAIIFITGRNIVFILGMTIGTIVGTVQFMLNKIKGAWMK